MNISTYIFTYIHIYIYISYYISCNISYSMFYVYVERQREINTYTYIHIRHRALRVGCDRASNVLSDSCYPTLYLVFVLIGPSPWSRRAWDLEDPPPCGPPLKMMVFATSLPNIHYFALWIHDIIQNICSESNVLFAFSLSCKSIIFTCLFKGLTKRKSKIV